MNLVRENINFERGQDPKKSMDIGMTTERKMDYVCQKCKEFGIDLEWKKTSNGEIELYVRNTPNHVTVYSIYDPQTQEFDNWNFPRTKSVERSIKQILLGEYEDIDGVIKNLEENLINIKRIKEFAKDEISSRKTV
jgi:hypothetical protein